MNEIQKLTDKIIKKGIYDIRVEYESNDVNEETPYINIRTLDFNGKESIHDFIDLLNHTKEYLKINSSCFFNIHSEIILTIPVDEDICIRNFNFFQKFIFESQTFNKCVYISNSIFKSEVKFAESTFNEKLVINRCVFEKLISLDSVCFNSGFKIEYVDFKYFCSFKNLNNNATLSRNGYSFKNVTFDERVFFNNSKFLNILSFKNCKFHEKVQFHSVDFKSSANFYNTSFFKLVDFYCAEFKSPQLFHLTDFLDKAIFSNTVFHNQLSYIHCKTQNDSFINFESATFKQSLDISRANFNCETNFWNIKIDKSSIIPKYFDVYNSDDLNNVSKEPISKEALQKLRESYRIIKNSLRKSGNEINALKFKSYEMIAYERELQLWDKGKTILFFSKWSNQHGLSWGYGFCFTIISALVFTYIFLMIPNNGLEWSWTKQARLETLNAFIQFLNIADWNPLLWGKDINSYKYGYLILFCSRIFISYGYYQTISAFRRYGRN